MYEIMKRKERNVCVYWGGGCRERERDTNLSSQNKVENKIIGESRAQLLYKNAAEIIRQW